MQDIPAVIPVPSEFSWWMPVLAGLVLLALRLVVTKSASLLETLFPRLIYDWIERHIVPHGDAFFLVLTFALMFLLYRHL